MAIKYFGGDGIITQTKQYIRNFNDAGAKHALLLVGSPGVGKTYLTEYIADENKVERILVNASEEKTQKSVNYILDVVKSKGARVIVVLDECEAMSTKNLDKIIKATKVPLFLCCNFIDMIDKDIISQCMIGKIEIPPWYIFKEYMETIMHKYGIPVPRNIDEIAKRARSFRHAERLIDDPDDHAPEPIETDKSQVEKILRGTPLEFVKMQPDTLMHWIHDNVHVPELASRVNVILEHAYLDDYHHWAYAYSLLQTVRSDKKVEIPRSFRLMKKIKEDVESHKRGDRDAALSNVKVDLSKVDVTAVKAGESLFGGLDDIDLDSLK